MLLGHSVLFFEYYPAADCSITSIFMIPQMSTVCLTLNQHLNPLYPQYVLPRPACLHSVNSLDPTKRFIRLAEKACEMKTTLNIQPAGEQVNIRFEQGKLYHRITERDTDAAKGARY